MFMEAISKEWQDAGLMTLTEVRAYELEKELGRNGKLILFWKERKKSLGGESSLEGWLKEE